MSTDLGPLTTTARPASCAADTEVHQIETITSSEFYDVFGPRDTANCMPPSYTAGTSHYYSPAASCPSGFTTACDPFLVTSIGDNDVLTTDIARICCPTQASMRCMTDPSWPWQTTLGCTIDSAIDRQSTVTVTRIYLNDTTVTVERVWNSVDPQNYGYGAYAVQLRAPTTSEDTSTSSAPTAASSSSTTTTSAAPTTVSDASTDATSAAISTGAVAGIAVGCVVAGIALIAAVFFVFRQQRRRWGGKPSELEATETLCDTKVQYVGDLRHDGDRRHGGYKEHDADPGRVASQELHDDPTTAGKQDVYEMRSDRATFELGAGPHDVHELRGSIPPAEMQG